MNATEKYVLKLRRAGERAQSKAMDLLNLADMIEEAALKQAQDEDVEQACLDLDKLEIK